MTSPLMDPKIAAIMAKFTGTEEKPKEEKPKVKEEQVKPPTNLEEFMKVEKLVMENIISRGESEKGLECI